MKFSFISVYPEMIESFFSFGILSRALQEKLISFEACSLRDFAPPPHKQVDDKPFGGGPGMVLQVEPIVKALRHLDSNSEGKTKKILMSAKATAFTQQKAEDWKNFDQLIFVCGRYEGVDERVLEFVDEEISVGDFVMMGGELAALSMTEAVARLVPGVIANPESLEDESHREAGVSEYPQYTRPREFEGLKVPEVLFSGDHKLISEWRKNKQNRNGEK